jgi:hypothetical protein
MSDLARLQELHDRWLAEKVERGDTDPGFPGPAGGLYYADDDDLWALFDAESGVA